MERCLWWRIHALWRQVTVLHTVETRQVFLLIAMNDRNVNSTIKNITFLFSNINRYLFKPETLPLLISDIFLVRSWMGGDQLYKHWRVIYLQSTSSGHRFVSIQCGAQLLPEEFADSLFDGRDPGSSTHYLYCIDVFLFQFLWNKKTSFITAYMYKPAYITFLD